MNDLMLKVLIVCAFISIIVSMIFEKDHRETGNRLIILAWIEGFAILVAVFIVSGVGSWNDYKKEEQFLQLYAFSKADEKVTATRNGAETDINYNDIKVGDIIRIRSGMYMPVDGIVLRERGQILTDESAMTGESIEQKKGTLNACLMRKEEKLKELEFSKG
jgi:Ca2+-transporting ATPase